MNAARPRAPQRAAPDTTARLESVEATQKLMMEKLDGITASLRALGTRDGEIDDRMNRFATEHRKGVESLAEALNQQQRTFSEALAKEADARRAQAAAFTEALEKQEARALEAWRAAVMKGLGTEVVGWLKTVGAGALMLAGSYYWTRLKG